MGKAVYNLIALVGAGVIAFFQYIGGLAILFWDSLKWAAKKGGIRFSLIMRQAAFLGVNSTAIVIITTAFTGAVISLQLAHLAVKYGAARFVGYGVALAMARELAPMLTAVVVSGRAGSAITAEIGSMKVTEQIDALEAMAVNPIKYLVVPRIAAMAIIIPMLSLFAIFAGTIGGAYVAKEIANIDYNTFFQSVKDFLESKDVIKGIFKSFIFAVQIALISCLQGLRTEGGAAGVGHSTTGAVVYSMLIIFITNFFLSAILFPPGGDGLW